MRGKKVDYNKIGHAMKFISRFPEVVVGFDTNRRFNPITVRLLN